MAGVPSCRSAHQAPKGAPWVGPYSVVQCLRRLMGQLLYCSAAYGGLWRERGYGDGSTPYTRLSTIALLPWLPGFPPQAFPPRSPPSHPLDPSLRSQQQPLNWDCSTVLKPQLLASAPSRRPAFLPGIMYGFGEDCLILIPFRLTQISYFTLSLKCFSSDSDNCPAVGIRPLLQFPHPLRAGPVLLTLLFFPLVPSSY